MALRATAFCLLMCMLHAFAAPLAADNTMLGSDSPKLDAPHLVTAIASGEMSTNEVARVDGISIPYEWFLHEFRSTYFRYEQSPKIRRDVLDKFLERMLLYRAAVQSGVDQEPAVRARINNQISSVRAYMEYQLAMTEVGQIIDAYLEQQGLSPTNFVATDEDIEKFMVETEAKNPGATEPFDSLPPHIQEQIRMRLNSEKRRTAVESLIKKLWGEFAVDINADVVDSVPFPTVIERPN